ncbi:MAG: GHKL domain-containing protein [Lachnospiraceae bacterium]
MEIYRLIGYAASSICLMGFLLLFLPLRRSLKMAVTGCVICVLIVLATDYLRFVVYDDSDIPIYLVVTLIQILAVQGTAFWLSKYKDWRTLFTGLFASNYVLIGNIIGVIVLVVTKKIVLGMLCGILSHVVLLVLLVLFMRQGYLNIMKQTGEGWLLLSIIPSLFYCSMYVLAFYPSSLYQKPDHIPATLFFMATMVSTYLIVIRYVQYHQISRETMEEKNLLEAYNKGLAIHSEAVFAAEKNVSILRHDMRHFLASLSVLLNNEKIEEAKAMLGAFQDNIGESRGMSYCENVQVNSVLCSICDKAERQGIRVEANLVISDQPQIEGLDLAMVIANLLENAINAAGKTENKNVKIIGRTVDKQLILEVKNAYAGQIEFDKDSGLPISKQGYGHGFGMQSIEAFVRKYQACFDCYAEKQQFTARLLMKL